MKLPPSSLNPDRRARVILWARMMLAWVALALFAPAVHIDCRHLQRRWGFLSLDVLERLVCALVLIRAVEIARPRGAPKPPPRNAAPAGFRRRTRRGALMRATIGSRLRRALKHHDPRERIARLLAALADIDGFAHRYLVPRALRRLTKLCATIMAAPPVCAFASLVAPTPSAVDSS